MKSNLLKIINNIDNSRKSLINTLKYKNYIVPNDATFNSIDGQIALYLPKRISEYEQEHGAVHVSDITNDVYYENPEDDPEVWKKPTDWPDIESILKSEPVQYDESGAKHIPFAVLLFEVNSDDPVTSISSTTYSSDANAYNTVLVANKLNLTYYGCKCLRTSDGTFIQYSTKYSSETVEHTWDTSKDIVIGNKRYRYIVWYVDSNSTYWNYPRTFGSGSNLKLVAAVMFYQLLSGAGSYGSNPSFVYGKDSNKNLQYIKFIDLRYSTAMSDDESVQKQFNRRALVQLTSACGLRYIEYDMSEDYKPTQGSFSGFGDILSAPYGVNTIVCNSLGVLFITGSKLMSFGLPASLVYYKGPVLPIRQSSRRLKVTPSDSASTVSSSYMVSNLKYAVIDEEVSMNTEYHCYANNSTSGPTQPAYGSYPRLKDFKCFQYANEITGYIYDNEGAFRQQHFIVYKCPSSGNFIYANADTIEFAVGDEIASLGMSGCCTCKIIHASATTLKLDTEYINSDTLRELILPMVDTITSSSTNYYLSGITLRTIYMPNLRTLPRSNIFNSSSYGRGLRDLILGDNFKSAIQLSQCYNLRKESILDLFDKLATLTDEEIATGTYSISLPSNGSYVDYRFTQDELDVALNKGWKVTY